MNKNILLPLLLLNFIGTICNISVAGVQNVSKIVIRPSTLTPISQRYLQVSEVVATENGTGKDLALSSAGATAIGESTWPGSSAQYAIDGIKPAGFPNIYHPASGHTSSRLTILLNSPSDLASLTVFGRTDCCSYRDRYNIELYDAENNILFSQNNLDARDSSHATSINLPDILFTSNTDPVANWEMDELYGGDATNEVVDSSGNNFSGTAIGSSSDQTGTTSTKQGICGYGKFNGQQQKIVVPYNEALNPDSFTVSLWAKVEGGSGTWRSPITSRYENSGASIRNGFNIYAGTNNRWQFWTGIGAAGWDILTGPAVSLNTWTHIAIYFAKTSIKNGRPYGLKQFYINGQLVAQKEAYYQPNTSDPLIIGGGGISGNTYFFNGSLSKVQLYNSPLSPQKIQSLSQPTIVPCPNYQQNTDIAAINFNCVETGTNGITGKLYTKTTAKSFNFDIVALKDTSHIESDFANSKDHTVTVELVDTKTGDGSCTNFSVLSPVVSQNLTFNSSDTGTKTSLPMYSNTAYRAVKCRITDATNSPPVVGCSTDSFAIRPKTFTISSTNLINNVTSSGFTNNPTSTSSLTPTTKAGEFFNLEFSGYTGMPNQIDNTKISAHPDLAATAGNLSGTRTGLLADDPFTGNFTYSEVGWFLLSTNAIYDDGFTDVDQPNDCINNFSNNPDTDGKVGCKFGNTANPNYFGRFTPDHFKVTSSSPGVFSDACTGFTYNGQTFGYQTSPTLTVTAYNGLSPATVTGNYTSFYKKLNATDFIVTPPTTDTNQIGVDGSTLVKLLSWVPGTASLTDNTDGSLTFAFVNDSFTHLHENNSKIAAFTPTVDFQFTNIIDSDGIQTQNLPYTAQASGTSIRFGRLKIDNSHGSELLDLPVSLTTQYWNGSNWILNSADQCSQIIGLSVNDPIATDGLIPSELCVLDSGSPGLSNLGCSIVDTSSKKFNEPPTAINPGDFNLNFKATGSGNTGALDITADIQDYLKFDWKGLGNTNPTARVTFGIYKGNSKQIYFREVY